MTSCVRDTADGQRKAESSGVGWRGGGGEAGHLSGMFASVSKPFLSKLAQSEAFLSDSHTLPLSLVQRKHRMLVFVCTKIISSFGSVGIV